MKAELYALTHRGNAGDAAFYGEVCGSAQSVLELGCGAGRLLTVLAGAKRSLVGLELDRELLTLGRRNVRALPAAKRKWLRLVRGDMRDFELRQRFDRVLLPYNALFCLTSKRAAVSCFRAVRRVLTPAGLFVMDAWNAAPFQRTVGGGASDERAPIVSLRHAGRTYDVFEHSRVRRSLQRLDVSYSYVPREGGATERIVIPQRYYLAPELERLLGRAGFEIVARYGDFSKKRFSARSPQLIILARPV